MTDATLNRKNSFNNVLLTVSGQAPTMLSSRKVGDATILHCTRDQNKINNQQRTIPWPSSKCRTGEFQPFSLKTPKSNDSTSMYSYVVKIMCSLSRNNFKSLMLPYAIYHIFINRNLPKKQGSELRNKNNKYEYHE